MKTEHAIDWRKTAAEIEADYSALCMDRDEQAERIRALESEVRVKDLTIGQMANTTQALEAHNAVLREALVVTHDLYAHASSGYGFARPDNPHNFSPDFECCSQEEIAAHSKACEDYDAGRKISNESWGIGAYCDEYAPALKALASTPESALAEIRLAERERCANVCEENSQRWPDPRKVYVAHELAAAIRQMED